MGLVCRAFKAFIRKIKGVSSEEVQHQWLIEHGLTEGTHVDCFSWNGIDAQYPGLITIGDYVTIASNVKLLAHDAGLGYLTRSTRIGVIEIGNHVFVGAGSIVLPNVRIGDWSVIGAGSIVTKDVPPNTVVAGNPARFICTTDQYKNKHEEGLRKLPVSFKPWREWAYAKPEEWAELKKQLKDTYGYVTAREDIKKEHE